MKLILQRFFFLLALLATLSASAAVHDLDRIVAVVNDDVILQSELDAQILTIKQQLQRQNTQLPPDAVLERQVLERMIQSKLQVQLAEQSGIRVDDETLGAAMRNIARQNGMSLSELRDTLEKDGFNFTLFREEVRKEIMITRVRQQRVANRIHVSPQEVDSYLENLPDKGAERSYHLGHILISVPEAATPDQIQAAREKAEKVLVSLRGGADFAETAVAVSDGQQALEGGDLGWRNEGQLPSLFADSVKNLQPGEISQPIRSPSGFHLVKLLEVRGDDQHMVTQTQARHILIRTNEVTSDETARNRLEQLKLRIEGGEDFGALARSHSDDTASAVDGGSLGWVNPGTMVPAFEQVMNGLSPGQISEPFRTEFGWHIVQVLDRREHDSTEELKRAQAWETIRKRKMEEELDLWLRRLRDEAYVEYRLEQ